MARKGTVEGARPQEQQSRTSGQGSSDGTAMPRSEIQGAATADGRDGQNGGDGRVSLSTADIAERAYQIFEREGRVDGKDMEHWLQAERELREERQKESTETNRARSSPGSRPARPDEAPRSARRHQTSMA